MVEKATNVTAENYAKKNDAFCTLAKAGGGNYGVMINRRSRPAQWRAWFSYFVGKRIGVRFMDVSDDWQVPALWPHEFDGGHDQGTDEKFKGSKPMHKGEYKRRRQTQTMETA